MRERLYALIVRVERETVKALRDLKKVRKTSVSVLERVELRALMVDLKNIHGESGAPIARWNVHPLQLSPPKPSSGPDQAEE